MSDTGEVHNVAPWPAMPIKNLADAYVKAQGEIGAAIKGNTNPHFKSKYADLGAVMDALKEPLAKYGLGFVQEVTEREGGVYVETVILHKSGETYRTGKLPMPAPKQDPHGYGSAITYAKRYSLQAAFGVPSEDDDGNKAAEGKAIEQVVEQAPRSRSTRAITADSADVTEEQKTELRKIGSSLIDLVNQERENVSIDHSYNMWEMVETMDQDRLLWLSLYLDKHPTVLSRLKAVMVEERRKLRAAAAAQLPATA